MLEPLELELQLLDMVSETELGSSGRAASLLNFSTTLSLLA